LIKIATFFNDAGASNNFVSLIKRYKDEYEWSFYLLKDSPAYKIFLQASMPIIEITPNTDIYTTLYQLQPSIILVGTGWQNKMHLDFIRSSNQLKIPSIASLDHWTNYKERFNYPNKNWKDNLPEYITVNDEVGYKIAQNATFKNIIKLKFYNLLDEIQSFHNIKSQEQNAILFISEPTQEVAYQHYRDENYWGFDEFIVCEAICKNIRLFATNKLTIRLHPSDEPQKYNYLHEKYKHINIEIENSYETKLIDSLSGHNTIIGIDGYVLYEAMILSKLAISLLPSSNRKCLVPLFQENILQSLDSIKLSQLKKEEQINSVASFGIDFATLIQKIITKS